MLPLRRQKEALLPEDLIAMLETLDRGTLRGLRDRAMLLIGFAGGLRRSEITGLDLGRDQTEDGRGWIEILDKGLLITLRGKTGWREVEIGRGSSEATCPVTAVETWIKFAKLAKGPLFRRVTGKGKNVGPDRLNDQEVARLVKKAALAAGVRGDLSEADREKLFAGHSLRAGLASSAEVDERYVQKQLGHASAEMTRKYQRRRDRFRVNLTKATFPTRCKLALRTAAINRVASTRRTASNWMSGSLLHGSECGRSRPFPQVTMRLA
jgi:integrase